MTMLTAEELLTLPPAVEGASSGELEIELISIRLNEVQPGRRLQACLRWWGQSKIGVKIAPGETLTYGIRCNADAMTRYLTDAEVVEAVISFLGDDSDASIGTAFIDVRRLPKQPFLRSDSQITSPASGAALGMLYMQMHLRFSELRAGRLQPQPALPGLFSQMLPSAARVLTLPTELLSIGEALDRWSGRRLSYPEQRFALLMLGNLLPGAAADARRLAAAVEECARAETAAAAEGVDGTASDFALALQATLRSPPPDLDASLSLWEVAQIMMEQRPQASLHQLRMLLASLRTSLGDRFSFRDVSEFCQGHLFEGDKFERESSEQPSARAERKPVSWSGIQTDDDSEAESPQPRSNFPDTLAQTLSRRGLGFETERLLSEDAVQQDQISGSAGRVLSGSSPRVSARIPDARLSVTQQERTDNLPAWTSDPRGPSLAFSNHPDPQPRPFTRFGWNFGETADEQPRLLPYGLMLSQQQGLGLQNLLCNLPVQLPAQGPVQQFVAHAPVGFPVSLAQLTDPPEQAVGFPAMEGAFVQPPDMTGAPPLGLDNQAEWQQNLQRNSREQGQQTVEGSQDQIQLRHRERAIRVSETQDLLSFDQPAAPIAQAKPINFEEARQRKSSASDEALEALIARAEELHKDMGRALQIHGQVTARQAARKAKPTNEAACSPLRRSGRSSTTGLGSADKENSVGSDPLRDHRAQALGAKPDLLPPADSATPKGESPAPAELDSDMLMQILNDSSLMGLPPAERFSEPFLATSADPQGQQETPPGSSRPRLQGEASGRWAEDDEGLILAEELREAAAAEGLLGPRHQQAEGFQNPAKKFEPHRQEVSVDTRKSNPTSLKAPIGQPGDPCSKLHTIEIVVLGLEGLPLPPQNLPADLQPTTVWLAYRFLGDPQPLLTNPVEWGEDVALDVRVQHEIVLPAGASLGHDSSSGGSRFEVWQQNPRGSAEVVAAAELLLEDIANLELGQRASDVGEPIAAFRCHLPLEPTWVSEPTQDLEPGPGRRACLQLQLKYRVSDAERREQEFNLKSSAPEACVSAECTQLWLQLRIGRACGLLDAVDQAVAWQENGQRGSSLSRARRCGPSAFLQVIWPDAFGEGSGAFSDVIPNKAAPDFRFDARCPLPLGDGGVSSSSQEEVIVEVWHLCRPAEAAAAALAAGRSSGSGEQQIFLGRASLKLAGLLGGNQGFLEWTQLKSRSGEPAGGIEVGLAVFSDESCTLPCRNLDRIFPGTAVTEARSPGEKLGRQLETEISVLGCLLPGRDRSSSSKRVAYSACYRLPGALGASQTRAENPRMSGVDGRTRLRVSWTHSSRSQTRAREFLENASSSKLLDLCLLEHRHRASRQPGGGETPPGQPVAFATLDIVQLFSERMTSSDDSGPAYHLQTPLFFPGSSRLSGSELLLKISFRLLEREEDDSANSHQPIWHPIISEDPWSGGCSGEESDAAERPLHAGAAVDDSSAGEEDRPSGGDAETPEKRSSSRSDLRSSEAAASTSQPGVRESTAVEPAASATPDPVMSLRIESALHVRGAFPGQDLAAMRARVALVATASDESAAWVLSTPPQPPQPSLAPGTVDVHWRHDSLLPACREQRLWLQVWAIIRQPLVREEGQDLANNDDNKLLGSVNVDLSPLDRLGEICGWYTIQSDRGTSIGQLKIRVCRLQQQVDSLAIESSRNANALEERAAADASNRTVDLRNVLANNLRGLDSLVASFSQQIPEDDAGSGAIHVAAVQPASDTDLEEENPGGGFQALNEPSSSRRDESAHTDPLNQAGRANFSERASYFPVSQLHHASEEPSDPDRLSPSSSRGELRYDSISGADVDALLETLGYGGGAAEPPPAFEAAPEMTSLSSMFGDLGIGGSYFDPDFDLGVPDLPVDASGREGEPQDGPSSEGSSGGSPSFSGGVEQDDQPAPGFEPLKTCSEGGDSMVHLEALLEDDNLSSASSEAGAQDADPQLPAGFSIPGAGSLMMGDGSGEDWLFSFSRAPREASGPVETPSDEPTLADQAAVSPLPVLQHVKPDVGPPEPADDDVSDGSDLQGDHEDDGATKGPPLHPLLALGVRPQSEAQLDGQTREHPLLTFDPFARRPSVELLPPLPEAAPSIWGLRTMAPSEFAAEHEFPPPSLPHRRSPDLKRPRSASSSQGVRRRLMHAKSSSLGELSTLAEEEEPLHSRPPPPQKPQNLRWTGPGDSDLAGADLTDEFSSAVAGRAASWPLTHQTLKGIRPVFTGRAVELPLRSPFDRPLSSSEESWGLSHSSLLHDVPELQTASSGSPCNPGSGGSPLGGTPQATSVVAEPQTAALGAQPANAADSVSGTIQHLPSLEEAVGEETDRSGSAPGNIDIQPPIQSASEIQEAVDPAGAIPGLVSEPPTENKQDTGEKHGVPRDLMSQHVPAERLSPDEKKATAEECETGIAEGDSKLPLESKLPSSAPSETPAQISSDPAAAGLGVAESAAAEGSGEDSCQQSSAVSTILGDSAPERGPTEAVAAENRSSQAPEAESQLADLRSTKTASDLSATEGNVGEGLAAIEVTTAPEAEGAKNRELQHFGSLISFDSSEYAAEAAQVEDPKATEAVPSHMPQADPPTKDDRCRNPAAQEVVIGRKDSGESPPSTWHLPTPAAQNRSSAPIAEFHESVAGDPSAGADLGFQRGRALVGEYPMSQRVLVQAENLQMGNADVWTSDPKSSRPASSQSPGNRHEWQTLRNSEEGFWHSSELSKGVQFSAHERPPLGLQESSAAGSSLNSSPLQPRHFPSFESTSQSLSAAPAAGKPIGISSLANQQTASGRAAPDSEFCGFQSPPLDSRGLVLRQRATEGIGQTGYGRGHTSVRFGAHGAGFGQTLGGEVQRRPAPRRRNFEAEEIDELFRDDQ